MHRNFSLHNKRIDNWLLKIQDLLPQILAIRYRKGVDNVGPDFLTRYDPLEPSSSLDASLQAPCAPTPVSEPDSAAVVALPSCLADTSSAASDLDWPLATETWDPIIVSPVITRSAAHALAQPPSSAAPAPHSGSPDSLSSTPSHSVAPPLPTSSEIPDAVDFSLSRIRAAQQLDPAIVPIFTSLPQSLPTHFLLLDDVVHRQFTNPKTGSTYVVPWLPTSLVSLALHAYHDHPLSGYFGVHRTLARLQQRFWWPKMRASVANYVASCDLCARHNIMRIKSPGHLKSIAPPSAVFQVLHLDLWGLLLSLLLEGTTTF